MATIKVRLTNRGADSETPWAEDLGPVGPGRRVRLINVPFLHAKPTWGDEIIVLPDEDGFPTWDRNGVAWRKVGTRIAADGGRGAMIVDYRGDGFLALAEVCHANDIICEGAWAPREGQLGRTYLAVPAALDDAAVMACLRAAQLPCELVQIHPEPATAKKPVAKKPVAEKKPAAKKKPSAKAKPAAKPAPKPAARPAARKPAKRRKK